MRRTCYNMGTAGGDSSPHLGPQSCPAYGSAQSGTGGRSDLNPSPGTPSMVTTCHAPPKGRISGTLPGLGGGKYLSSPPLSHYAAPANGLSGTLMLGPLCTQDIGRIGVFCSNGSYTPPSSGGCRPLCIASLWHERVYTKFLMPS